MKDIIVYTGKGAFQAKDIENFLAVFDYEYERICEHGLDRLNPEAVLIISGGSIGEYLPSWGEVGINKIRAFVEAGGTYIGICAGTYIAGSIYREHAGLNFINREFPYKRSLEDVKAVWGDETIELLKENGPSLLETDGEVILRDTKGEPHLIKKILGKGSIYLFSSHPEGSLYYNKYPKDYSGVKFFKSFLEGLK